MSVESAEPNETCRIASFVRARDNSLDGVIADVLYGADGTAQYRPGQGDTANNDKEHQIVKSHGGQIVALRRHCRGADCHMASI